MSEEQEELNLTDEAKAEAARPAKKKVSAPRTLGRIAGAGVAIPTAAIVFCVAALAGVPATTAVTRSVVTATFMWIVVGITIRLLFTFVIRDWRQKLTATVPVEKELPHE